MSRRGHLRGIRREVRFIGLCYRKAKRQGKLTPELAGEFRLWLNSEFRMRDKFGPKRMARPRIERRWFLRLTEQDIRSRRSRERGT